jgi:hypothetical protein
MMQIQIYDVVRVAVLKDLDRSFDGSDGVKRPPQIGDKATVCHDYDPDDPTATVAVEMVNEDGLTVWLADFDRDELELVSRHK